MAYQKFLLRIRHQETQGAAASMQNDPMLISCVNGLPEFGFFRLKKPLDDKLWSYNRKNRKIPVCARGPPFKNILSCP
jgi:hypothetical protein